MVPYYGDFPINHTSVVIPFNAFTSNDPSASATITDFANTDVHIHKNGSLAQRASAAGVAIDIDVDGITGCHWITIDLSDDTDAGFYVAGAEISVRIEGVTIDGATVNAFVGAFSIERAGGALALIGALNDISVANIIAGIADGAYDLQEMMRIMFATLAGKSSGGGTTTNNFRDSADSKNRISATVDASGNRTAVTLDAS